MNIIKGGRGGTAGKTATGHLLRLVESDMVKSLVYMLLHLYYCTWYVVGMPLSWLQLYKKDTPYVVIML